MKWASKNLGVLRTTLQIISISLYKIVDFHFTKYKDFTLQIVKTTDQKMSLFLVVVGVIDAFHESFAIVYFIGQGPCHELSDDFVINCTYDHGIHVIVLANFTPINAFGKFFF